MVQALAGPGFDVIPSALSQGTLAPADLQAMAARWGAQLRAAGVNVNFAPVADVVPPGTDSQNAPIGQLQREYGHDPATVATHALAFMAGMRQAALATTVKHFPGPRQGRGQHGLHQRGDRFRHDAARSVPGSIRVRGERRRPVRDGLARDLRADRP